MFEKRISIAYGAGAVKGNLATDRLCFDPA
jgi:hypothetical protein